MSKAHDDIQNALSVSQSFNADSSVTEQRVRLNHDLRTSVSSILGLAQIARENTSPEFVNDCLTGIETSSRQLLSLIDALYGIDVERINIPERSAINADLNGASVLLAEDDFINLQIAQFFLEEAGARVITTCNGEEALKAFEGSPEGYFDVIVTDIEMPLMDGYSLAKAVRTSKRKDGAKMPIVALTAHTLEDAVRAGRDSGINAHIPKPLDMEIMVNTLHGLIKRADTGSAADSYSVGKRLGWLVEFVRIKKSVTASIRKSAGLNHTQGRILLHVAANPPETIGAIAQSLHLSSNTVTTSVDVLEKLGYAKRDTDTEDRREVRLSTTRAGKDAAYAYARATIDAIDEKPFWAIAMEQGAFTYAPTPSASLGTFFGKVSFEKTRERIKRELELGDDQPLSVDDVAKTSLAEMALCCLSEEVTANKKSGLKGNESLVLRVLAKDDSSLCSSTIGKQIKAGANTMAVATGSLFERGFISRSADPKDARATLLSLTDEGKEFLRSVNPRYCSVFDSHFPGLKDHETEEYEDLVVSSL